MADLIPALQMLGTASVTVGLATCTVQVRCSARCLVWPSLLYFCTRGPRDRAVLTLRGSKQQLREMHDDNSPSCSARRSTGGRTSGQDHL